MDELGRVALGLCVRLLLVAGLAAGCGSAGTAQRGAPRKRTPAETVVRPAPPPAEYWIAPPEATAPSGEKEASAPPLQEGTLPTAVLRDAPLEGAIAAIEQGKSGRVVRVILTSGWQIERDRSGAASARKIGVAVVNRSPERCSVTTSVFWQLHDGVGFNGPLQMLTIGESFLVPCSAIQ